MFLKKIHEVLNLVKKAKYHHILKNKHEQPSLIFYNSFLKIRKVKFPTTLNEIKASGSPKQFSIKMS